MQKSSENPVYFEISDVKKYCYSLPGTWIFHTCSTPCLLTLLLGACLYLEKRVLILIFESELFSSSLEVVAEKHPNHEK
ncbi:hypothetical protein JTE90_000757 [Oedothorax gibbosus]|uniref:Uncharacterized protein n=1 Tax=Oedothorax gibbosus TaxID=931172 RepID=A0AAV6UR67_9ARAC|nr:hypothetical protein JTE90_000757 [Oedothorax gibbosus]